MKRIAFVGSILVLLGLGSCLKDEDFFDAREQLRDEQIRIDAFLLQEGLTAKQDTVYGLKYVVLSEGDSIHPVDSSVLMVSYEGRLLSGGVFDDGDSVDFKLSNTIPGWRILMPYIKEGGSAKLFIPSGYAYGSTGVNSIPANSTLVFDVELHKVLPNQRQMDDFKIDTYIEDNAFEVKSDLIEGLKYRITTEGTGVQPADSSEVSFDVKGTFLNGESFTESSVEKFPVGQLLSGMKVLIRYLKEGGTMIMYLPSQFAYGSAGLQGKVPSNTVVIFEVTLNEVINE